MTTINDPVFLYHGTTLTSAQSIVENGWQEFDIQFALESLSEEYGIKLSDMLEDLERLGRFSVVEQGRGTYASFATTMGKAQHNWAQRAPEAHWEALWCIYRIKYMNSEDADFWNRSVAGHAWVWEQMRHEALAVVRFSTSLDELVRLGVFDWEAGARKLANRKVFELTPEVKIKSPLRPSADQIEIFPVARHLAWDVYAEVLGVEQEEFISRAERGEFGRPASDDVEAPDPLLTRPWWDSSTAPFVGRPSRTNRTSLGQRYNADALAQPNSRTYPKP